MISSFSIVALLLLSGHGVLQELPSQTPASNARQPVAPPLPFQSVTELRRQTDAAFTPVGPIEIHRGTAVVGDILATAPARHGLTGRLRSPLTFRGYSAGQPPLPAGTPVYAVRLNGGKLSWCAPYQGRSPRTRRPRWEANCAVPSLGYVAHGQAFAHGMLVERVRFVGHAQEADVSIEPVDFGVPMRIIYVLDGWRRGKPLIRGYAEIDGDRGENIISYASIESAGESRWTAQIQGQRIDLRASSSGRDVVIEPQTSGR